MDEDLVGAIMVSFSTVLVCVTAVMTVSAAARGALDPQGVAGIRTRHTRASSAAWVAGHAAALPRVRCSVPVAVFAVAVTAAMMVLGSPGWALLTAMAGLLLQCVVVVSAVGPANRAARRAAPENASRSDSQR